MAEFKGIKQSFLAAYIDAPLEEKKGYLWFVRENSGNTDGDVYFGTRHYGHFSNEDAAEIAKIEQIVSDVEQNTSGLTVVQDSIGEIIEKLAVEESTIKELRKSIESLEASALQEGKDINISGNTIDVAIDEDITVAGLSDTYGCGLIKNGNRIPAGTSLSEILKMMLSKEINPKAATKPYIAITKTGTASGLHEIGENVSVGIAQISKKGGIFNNDGWASPSQPSAIFEWSDEKMSSSSNSGAEDYAEQTDAASITTANATTSKGLNRINISASANYSAPSNKPITNLNKPYDGDEATWKGGIATASTTIEWTGVYPCFTNASALGEEPMDKLALTSGKEFNVSVASHNDNDFRFAYPDGWMIGSFQVKSLDGTYPDYAGDYEKNAGDIDKTIQGNVVKYHYLSVKNGASDYKIILDKNLNV